MNDFQKMVDEIRLRRELVALERKHQELDDGLCALQKSESPDPLRLQRLKRRGSELQRRILQIKDLLTPDIIA